MKKQAQKLEIARETLRRLTLPTRVVGGRDTAVGIDWTGCMSECTECGGGLAAW